MKIIVKTNFPFNVQNIGFSASGELVISLSSTESDNENHYSYEADFGASSAVARPVVKLLDYTAAYVSKTCILYLFFIHTLSSICSQ